MKRLFAFALALALTLSLAAGAASGAGGQFSGPTKDEFLKVLHSKAPFLMKDIEQEGVENKGKHILLKDVLNDPDFSRDIEQFTVFDLDGDGAPEVLLELSMNGDRLVFHFEKGEIYGFMIPFRGMVDLKRDGSADGSDGADDSSISKFQFKDGTCKYADTIQNPSDAVMEKQEKKENVEWYPYSKDTFDADFATAWKNMPARQ